MTTDIRIRREQASISGQIVEILRRVIIAGELEPGTRLVERDLCERFAVSRGPVREALRQLSAEGLVRHEAHRGPTVERVTEQDVRDLYRVRGCLEGLAGETFALRASDEELEQLRGAAAPVFSLEEGDPIERLIAVKNAFYAALLEGSHSPVISDSLTRLNNRISQYRRLSLSRPGRLAETKAEMREVVEACLARDAARARRACEDHVARAAEAALAQVPNLPRANQPGANHPNANDPTDRSETDA
ncbi:transcriptional regulator, GntR family [Tistlia consotensis]|uniref:Transcriptional regulator, GntR family n=1 Tax=Tistlia consotensis USBA 355 TaxID=560819 RepID=A0A1Y6CI22_9PROT|nr:GntR family transcriptional regulator [Tistlia consotensis]SMF65530.1 transcriptional regulator, GntR family [Tistlia consotensis USBA 355]SNS03621.1 transcriptional regulator, GntR family [Tistlia consotensis]